MIADGGFGRRLLLLLVAILAGPVCPAAAQLTAAVEGNRSQVSYADASSVSTYSITPSLEWLTSSFSLTSSASFSQFVAGGWTFQGGAGASVFSGRFAGFRAELAGGGIGSTNQDGTAAGEVLGRVRVHRFGALAGAWLGGAVGRGWNGLSWETDRRADLGAWIRHGGLTLSAIAAPTWLGDSLRFVDANLMLRLIVGAVDLYALGGARSWSQPSGAAADFWGNANAAFWVGRHVALVAAGGSYPTDYAQGLPSGAYFSVGLRLATRRSGRDVPRPVVPRITEAPGAPPNVTDPRLFTPVVPAFEVRAAGAGQRSIRVRAPDARRVELMGDFTQWQVIPLERQPDGTWSVTLSLSPGAYRMNIRVDGGAWGVPPGVPALSDDFGGVVGVLNIEGR